MDHKVDQSRELTTRAENALADIKTLQTRINSIHVEIPSLPTDLLDKLAEFAREKGLPELVVMEIFAERIVEEDLAALYQIAGNEMIRNNTEMHKVTKNEILKTANLLPDSYSKLDALQVMLELAELLPEYIGKYRYSFFVYARLGTYDPDTLLTVDKTLQTAAGDLFTDVISKLERFSELPLSLQKAYLNSLSNGRGYKPASTTPYVPDLDVEQLSSMSEDEVRLMTFHMNREVQVRMTEVMLSMIYPEGFDRVLEENGIEVEIDWYELISEMVQIAFGKEKPLRDRLTEWVDLFAQRGISDPEHILLIGSEICDFLSAAKDLISLSSSEVATDAIANSATVVVQNVLHHQGMLPRILDQD